MTADALRRRIAGRSVLTDIHLRVGAGEAVGVLGENGAGKTTLLRTLAGLLRPHGGTLRVFGHDPHTEPAQTRRRTGVVAHEPYLYEGLTVAENLRLFCALYGDAPADWDTLLAESGLARRRDHLVRHLSRGWVQRAAIVRALLPRPDLLILDEPFAGLDQAGAEWLRGRMAHHLGRGGAIVVTTHRVDELDGLRVRVARLEGGALRAE